MPSRSLFRVILLGLACASFTPLGTQAQTVPQQTPPSAANAAATQSLHALFVRYWEETASLFPEWATWRGDHRYGDRLTDASPAGRVSLDMFIGRHERGIAMFPFDGFRRMSLRSVGGYQTGFSDLLQAVPVDSPERIEKLFKRFEAFPLRLDQEVASLRVAVAAGWVPPKSVLERVLGQIDGQLNAALDKSPDVAPFEKLPRSMSETERAALQARGRDAITRHVLPAMRKLRAFVADEVLPQAKLDGAYPNYPQGAQVYAKLVESATTTKLTLAQIHAIGQVELTALRAEMEGVCARPGSTATSRSSWPT